jgi:hypothetical protein
MGLGVLLTSQGSCPVVHAYGSGVWDKPFQSPQGIRTGYTTLAPTPSLALWRASASPWRENFPAPRLLPTAAQKPPEGPQWVHEIKHDGYRLIARRQGNRSRLFTRRGYDWSGKYPQIVESLLSLKVQSCIIDGEGVWAGPDGKSDFDKLHSGIHDEQVFLYALYRFYIRVS